MIFLQALRSFRKLHTPPQVILPPYPLPPSVGPKNISETPSTAHLALNTFLPQHLRHTAQSQRSADFLPLDPLHHIRGHLQISASDPMWGTTCGEISPSLDFGWKTPHERTGLKWREAGDVRVAQRKGIESCDFFCVIFKTKRWRTIHSESQRAK